MKNSASPFPRLTLLLRCLPGFPFNSFAMPHRASASVPLRVIVSPCLSWSNTASPLRSRTTQSFSFAHPCSSALFRCVPFASMRRVAIPWRIQALPFTSVSAPCISVKTTANPLRFKAFQFITSLFLCASASLVLAPCLSVSVLRTLQHSYATLFLCTSVPPRANNAIPLQRFAHPQHFWSEHVLFIA